MSDKKLPGRIRLVRDEDYRWDDLDGDSDIKIAYLSSSRHTLGTEGVSSGRMDEIRDGIARGSLIGIPVYAYVHSGATIRCFEGAPSYPYDDRWDAGQSGYVYVGKEAARDGWGVKLKDGRRRLTKAAREDVLRGLRGYVESYDLYLRGDCWGFVVEEAAEDPLRPGEQMLDGNGEPVWDDGDDSCFGFLGSDWKTNGMAGYIQEYIDRGYKVCEE